MVEDGFLGVAEASKFLGVCRSKIYQLMDTGQLAFAKFGRARRIPKRALREYAGRCMVSDGAAG
jgi:excisionase family DNA binding protein